MMPIAIATVLPSSSSGLHCGGTTLRATVTIDDDDDDDDVQSVGTMTITRACVLGTTGT